MIRCIHIFLSFGMGVAATAATPQFFDASAESAMPGIHEALLLTESQKAHLDEVYAQLLPQYGTVDEAEFRRRGLVVLSAPQLQLVADIEEAIAGIRSKVEAEFAKNSNPIEHLAARQKREMIAMRIAWQLPAELTPLQRQAVAAANQQTPEPVQTPSAKIPMDELPAEDFSMDELPAEDFSMDELPAEDFSTDELPAEDVLPMDLRSAEMLSTDVTPTAVAPTDIGTSDSANQPSQPAEKDVAEFLEDNIGNKTNVRGFEAKTGPNQLGRKAKIGGFEIETSPNLLGKKAKMGGFEIVSPPPRRNDEAKADEKVSDSRNPVPDQ